MTLFARSFIANFGQNAQFSKKNIQFAPKNDNNQKNEERKYNGLMKDLFEGGRSDLNFYHYYDSI